MVDPTISNAADALTTDFRTMLAPLFAINRINREIQPPQRPINRIGKMALYVYCPITPIANYQHLLCQEMALKKFDYDARQPVKALWFLGHPWKQLSPEALTELCFRFSNHFPHNDELNATRGIAVTSADLTKDTLALLSGLKFNRVELAIDASVAGHDRSLTKVEAGLRLLTDYSHVKLHCKIKFSTHTHPNFLARLLELITAADCLQVEIARHKHQRPALVEDNKPPTDHLRLVQQFFADLGWVSCGNNTFYSPRHEYTALIQRRRLLLTPWGFHDRQIQTWLGLGVAAISGSPHRYLHNTDNAEGYEGAILNKQTGAVTEYSLAPQRAHLMNILQQAVCYHRVENSDNVLANFLTLPAASEWLVTEGDHFRVSEHGIVNLALMSKILYAQADTGNRNSRTGTGSHSRCKF